MSKPISLTVHKNTLHQRRRKELRKSALEQMSRCIGPDAAGYTIISWNHDGDANVSWDIRGGHIHGHMLPMFVHGILAQKLVEIECADD